MVYVGNHRSVSKLTIIVCIIKNQLADSDGLDTFPSNVQFPIFVTLFELLLK